MGLRATLFFKSFETATVILILFLFYKDTMYTNKVFRFTGAIIYITYMKYFNYTTIETQKGSQSIVNNNCKHFICNNKFV